MDVGKQRCRAAVTDREGSIIDEFAFANNHQGIEHLASRLTMDDRVAIESTGSVWLNPYERFDERRIPVVLANVLKTQATAGTGITTDGLAAIGIAVTVLVIVVVALRRRGKRAL